MPEDESFVRQLVVEFVMEDLAMRDWPEPMRNHLLDIQYRIRRQNIHRDPPRTSSRIVLLDDRPAGWLVLSDSEGVIHVVDIIVQTQHRGKGVGSAVLKGVLMESERAGKTVRLAVRSDNRAVRLYQRLGFATTGSDGLQHFMERRPSVQGDS